LQAANQAGQRIGRVVRVTGREDVVMTASFGAVVLSTSRPMELAAFYRELLGWIVVAEDPDWVRLRDPERERPGVEFSSRAGRHACDVAGREGGVQMQRTWTFSSMTW
jgi:hypothetical protein